MHFPVFIFRLTLQLRTPIMILHSLVFFMLLDQDGSRVPEFTCISEVYNDRRENQ